MPGTGKKKTARIMVAMRCGVCKSHNYITVRNKTNTPEKLILKKYCKRCKKHTEHKETSKLD